MGRGGWRGGEGWGAGEEMVRERDREEGEGRVWETEKGWGSSGELWAERGGIAREGVMEAGDVGGWKGPGLQTRLNIRCALHLFPHAGIQWMSAYFSRTQQKKCTPKMCLDHRTLKIIVKVQRL